MADLTQGADPSTPLRVAPVVMSGGSGTRLWPLSTQDAPKQFHPLASSLIMIQDTVGRARAYPGIEFTAPIIICNRRHLAAVQSQLSAVGVAPSAIVLEPFGRNTAAVTSIAARLVAELHPGMLALLMPADHIIEDKPAFLDAVYRGARLEDQIVTFGIRATAPEAGYGYIQHGEPLGEGLFAVARFVEKPDRRTAEAYLAEGGYHWNSGIFLFAPEVMLAELRDHRPDILDAADISLAGARIADHVIDLPDALFAKVPSQSIDAAVMERTSLAAMAYCDAGWADVGSWSEIWRLGPRDARGNRIHGDAIVLGCEQSLVWAGEEVIVGAVGLENVIVVAAHGAVLVLPRSRAQDVREIVKALERRRQGAAGAPSPPGGAPGSL